MSAMERPGDSRGKAAGREQEQDHWLARPSSIRLLWIVFPAILALTVVASFVVHAHPYFGIDGTFAFAAWYGFVSCVAMVVFAKVLGIFLKRRDTYYDQP